MSNKYNHQKGVQATNYILTKLGGREDKTKVIKLLWAADRYHLRKYGRLVSNDTYYALKKGPVASQTLDIINRADEYLGKGWKEYSKGYLSPVKEGKVIKSLKKVNEKYLSDTDKEALDFAISHLGNLSTSAIVEFTHKYPEWQEHKKSLEKGVSGRRNIDINKFFEDPEDKKDDIFALPKEQLNTSKDIYQEMQSIIK